MGERAEVGEGLRTCGVSIRGDGVPGYLAVASFVIFESRDALGTPRAKMPAPRSLPPTEVFQLLHFPSLPSFPDFPYFPYHPSINTSLNKPGVFESIEIGPENLTMSRFDKPIDSSKRLIPPLAGETVRPAAE